MSRFQISNDNLRVGGSILIYTHPTLSRIGSDPLAKNISISGFVHENKIECDGKEDTRSMRHRWRRGSFHPAPITLFIFNFTKTVFWMTIYKRFCNVIPCIGLGAWLNYDNVARLSEDDLDKQSTPHHRMKVIATSIYASSVEQLQ
jgi:hypothetical protein